MLETVVWAHMMEPSFLTYCFSIVPWVRAPETSRATSALLTGRSPGNSATKNVS